MDENRQIKTLTIRVPVEMIKIVEKIQDTFQKKKGFTPSQPEVFRMIAYELNKRPMYVT
jgi:hypothetical protein